MTLEQNLSPQQREHLERLMAAMSWEDKLNQIQIAYLRSEDERAQAARAGIGALFWPGTAIGTNMAQRAAVEDSAHGIPLLIGLDVIHGQRTTFPIPLAMASSFDPNVAHSCARISALEARSGGVTWTFAPMVDISRDARWGRVAEGFGEDPTVASAMGAAMVHGFQSEDLSNSGTVAACAKHYIGYGAAEGGRDDNTVDMSAQRLHNVYLKPFAACVKAGVASVMASFNTFNGRPVHANRFLLTQLLKRDLAFGGVIVGDASGVANLVSHGVATDLADAARQSLTAGLDVEMGGNLIDLAGSALLSSDDPDLVKRVEDACRRMLTVKFDMGLFDSPYVDETQEITAPTDQSRAASRSAAEKCQVLLSNDGTLPIASQTKRILVAGPGAATTDHLGAWVQAFAAPPELTLAHALRQAMPGVHIDVLPGCDVLEGSAPALADVVAAAHAYDLVILALTEPSDLSGEASSRADLKLPGDQEGLIHAVADTGTPCVAVLTNGRPLDISSWATRVNAILEAWHLGVEGPRVIADILTGVVNPSGRLPMAFPRAVGQYPSIHHAHENTGRPPHESAARCTRASSTWGSTGQPILKRPSQPSTEISTLVP